MTGNCPICGAKAEEFWDVEAGFRRFKCPKHDEFEVSQSAMTVRHGAWVYQEFWERALEHAKLRAESGELPRIEGADFDEPRG
jgi:hypothetical protein